MPNNLEIGPEHASESEKFNVFNFDGNVFTEFLQWLIDRGGFNDLYIMSGYRIYARIDGYITTVVPNSMSKHNVEALARIVSNNDQIESKIIKGQTDDPVYIHYDTKVRGLQHRFRVNIKGIRALGGGDGMGITLRQISPKAPTPDVLGVEAAVRGGFTPKDGIVIISGPTGSGKSTLFASLLGDLVEKNESDRVIGTCEAPIEFTFDHLDMRRVVIYQSSIDAVGGNIDSFDNGVRASLRSGTNGTVIGELRDLETIRAAMTASNTGQTVWGTLHVNSVVDMPPRVINVFPSQEVNKVRVEFYSNIRFLMCQRLVPCIKPGQARIAVREWLDTTKSMRRQLIACPPQEETNLLQKFVNEHGMPMSRYAKNLYEQGLISEDTYQFIVDGE